MEFSRTAGSGGMIRVATAYVLSVLAVGAAIVVTESVPPLHTTPTVLFFAVIVSAAWLGGKGPAIVAVILSSLAVDYFLVTPYFSLLADVADLVRFVGFGLVAAATLYLQENYHRLAIRLHEANEALEVRVAARTADLAAANRSLLAEIEERTEVEAALKQSEQNLRSALDNVQASLKEKEILLRELQHRVKNNLQIIVSLLSLQGKRSRSRDCEEVLKECQHRVRAIALVHQRLCGAASLASIDLTYYFSQLVDELHRSYYVGNGTIHPHVEVEDIVLGIDQLIPAALIVNELACNAFKYAFPDDRSGDVRIGLRRDGENVRLSVADNGVGFAPDESNQQDTVGLQIVEALSDQLSGTIHWTNGERTAATITFPVSNN